MELIDRAKTRDDVKSIFEHGHYQHLEIPAFDTPTWKANAAIMVLTELELGAGNWVVWIDFDGDRIRSRRVRILDSDAVRPKGAPVDLEFK